MNILKILFFLALLPIYQSQAEPGFDDVKRLIKDQQITDVDTLLKVLKKEYPELFVVPTLVFDSQGPEQEDVSPEFPRTIKGNSKMSIAYTGKPGGKFYQNIRFVVEPKDPMDPTAKTEMKEITFTPGSPPHIDENPTSCTRCHGVPAKRNFDSYDIWPGMYGMSDNLAFPEEKKKWAEFYAHGFNNGRYALIDKTQFSGDYKDGKILSNANVELNSLFGTQNLQRIARQIRSHKDYRQYRGAFLAAALGCSNFEKFIPLGFRSKDGKTYEEVQKDTVSLIKKYHENRYERIGGKPQTFYLKDRYEPGLSNEITSKLRYLADGLGLDTGRWSLSLQKNTYVMMDGGGAIAKIAGMLKYDGVTLNLNENYYDGSEAAKKADCDKLLELQASQNKVSPENSDPSSVKSSSVPPMHE